MNPSVHRAVLDASASRMPVFFLLIDALASTRRHAWAFGRRNAQNTPWRGRGAPFRTQVPARSILANVTTRE